MQRQVSSRNYKHIILNNKSILIGKFKIFLSNLANETEIKKAYRKKAMEFHPDRHANANEEERLNQERKFKDVSEAYTILLDPHKKQRYDLGYDDNGPSPMNSGSSFNADSFRMFCDDDILNNIFFNFKR